VARRKPVAKTIEYQPPPGEVLDQFARDVCKRLGDTLGAEFYTPETVRDLSAFLRVTSTAWAKHLNSQQPKGKS
jgi:hypothetical protein